MEANQASTQQSVCPKCGKSVQSDFTRCPYCGAKLQVDPNDKVEKVKQGFFNFLSKAKDFFISAGKLAMSHKKITIAVSAVLVLLIVLIPIITTFTNPLHPNNVAKVDVGVLTEQQIKDTYGQPSNVINAYSIQGISLGVAQGMCREAWVYYDDAFAKKLKAFEEKFNNAESFEDLEKLDKEYNKLTKEKFDCLVVGFDTDGNVSFVCLNKNAKYDELDVFASKEPKELKNIELTKNTLCRGSSVAASNISYIAKYKDGSLVKAKITTNGTTNEEQTATKIDIQSIFGEYTVNLRMVDHVFDSNCLCKNCGQEHKLNEYCRCELCDRYFHDMQGCECKNCDYNTHTPGSDCKCTICNQTIHTLDENCKCTQCDIVEHKYDEDKICIKCNVDKQGLKYTLCSGTDDQGDDIQYYAVEYSPNATGTVVIPSTIKQLPVLAISAEAFRGCDNLTKITIPDSVTSIGEDAFNNCSNLTSITFAENSKLTSIGNYAFYDCSSLTNITIPDSVTSIGEYAFSGCSILTSIIIPNSVTSIGYSAFYGCSSFTSITMPFVIGSIGYIFNYHVPSSLKTVTITGGTSIGHMAFADCSSLTSITFEENSQLTSIGYQAFYGCSSLKSITIPDSVTSIANRAFYDCSSLTSITIGNGVTSIGQSAFEDCSSLTSITIGNSVTSIGEFAFRGCSSLTRVDITDIGKWCAVSFGTNHNDWQANPLVYAENLYNNGELVTDLVIPDGVTSIGYDAFYNCSSLTSITIPDSVTSIGISAFRDCSSLTSINIPDSVTSIGWWAFDGCSSLTSVNITDLAKWCDISFSDIYSFGITNPLYYAHNLYLNGDLVTNLVIPDSVTSIGSNTFRSCSSLTSITIPNSVTSIREYAFRGCSSLTSVTIGNGVMDIGKYAFDGCSSLTSITIPNSVTSSIGDYTFSGCGSLTSITIPDGVTSIGDYAFCGCSSLTSITIPDSVTSIGYNAFGYCSSLTRVDITDIAKWFDISFGNVIANPLSYAHKLYLNGELVTNLVISDSVTSIGSSAFNGCSSLTSITIPDSVTSIGSYAFRGCRSLTSITIPDSVTSIGSYAFYDCDIIITFQGTKAQWNAISKGEHWYYHLGLSNFTINCTDGTIKVYC